MKAAKALIGQLQSDHPVLISHISKLCEAYVDLAYHDVSAYKMEKSKFHCCNIVCSSTLLV